MAGLSAVAYEALEPSRSIFIGIDYSHGGGFRSHHFIDRPAEYYHSAEQPDNPIQVIRSPRHPTDR